MVSTETIHYLALILISISTTRLIISFIKAKLEISISEEVENYLWKTRWYRLGKTVNVFAKLLTFEEDKQNQKLYMEKHREVEEKTKAVIQRELHLLEERDALHARVNSLNAYEAHLLAGIEKEIEGIGYRHWLTFQEYPTRLRGAWVREYWRMEADDLWDMQSPVCNNKGGCCSRSCGCCEQPRRGRDGQTGSSNPDTNMHCTAECGCCLRLRGFYRSPEEIGVEKNEDVESDCDLVVI